MAAGLELLAPTLCPHSIVYFTYPCAEHVRLLLAAAMALA